MSEITYRDCLITAAKFLELNDVEDALKSGSVSFEGELERTIMRLISCADLVLHEIACDYIPLKKIDTLKSKNCRIYFKDLSKNVVDFYKVERGGRRVKFEAFHDSILLPYDASFDITYSYAPVKGTLATKLEWDGQRVGDRIVAYGVACEFGLMNGLLDDAALWDKRFKDALFKASIDKNEKVIKSRIWV